jgi:hypothetical protein
MVSKRAAAGEICAHKTAIRNRAGSKSALVWASKLIVVRTNPYGRTRLMCVELSLVGLRNIPLGLQSRRVAARRIMKTAAVLFDADLPEGPARCKLIRVRGILMWSPFPRVRLLETVCVESEYQSNSRAIDRFCLHAEFCISDPAARTISDAP